MLVTKRALLPGIMYNSRCGFSCTWHGYSHLRCLSQITSIPRLLAHITVGGYRLQHHTRWCSADTIIATVEECNRAKTALNPKADAMKTENFKDAPKGCSLYKGQWIFNTHATGKLDGISEPVCKAEAGAHACDAYGRKPLRRHLFMHMHRFPVALVRFD